MLTFVMTDLNLTTTAFQPAHAVCLPLAFDVVPLLAEVDQLTADHWITHFNTGYHDGGWTGIPLLSEHGDGDSLYAASTEQPSFDVRPMPFGQRCPLLLAAIAQLHCRVKSARLLRLAPGSVIREHVDADLIWREGEARLHIPLVTHDRVEFYVDGERVLMRDGECWYLNLSRPHRVQNLGTTARVHLVLDCAVNAWLTAQVQSGAPLQTRTLAPTGASQFAQFRERVFSDPSLQAALRNCTELDALMTLSVAMGRERGLHFSPEDVRAQAQLGRREWMQQWIV